MKFNLNIFNYVARNERVVQGEAAYLQTITADGRTWRRHIVHGR